MYRYLAKTLSILSDSIAITTYYCMLCQHHVSQVENKMAMLKNQVGFECEFVDEPPQYLQTECPVCLQILREPYQVTCCGKSFCRQCIERVKAEHKRCPCCKQDNFNDFPNKGLQQPLYGFKVLCTNKGKCCEWKGELSQLDHHLNLNPQGGDKQLEGCKLAEVKCSYCSKFLMRIALLNHKVNFCGKRPFTCEYCNNYESTYDDVACNHWPTCVYHPVQCLNNCGALPQRRNLESHLQNECPLTLVECDLQYAGCEVKLPRKDMSDHLKDGLVTHFSLFAVSHKQQQEEMNEIKALNDRQKEEIEEVKTLNDRQRDEIQALTEEVKKLKLKIRQLTLYTIIVPVDLKVENPQQFLGLEWSLTPFYSHSQGYKLRIGVYNSLWTGAYFIRAYLMQGEFDDFLKWPLNAVIIIHVLSRQSKHLERKIKLHNKNRMRSGDTETYSGTDIGKDLTPHLHSDCLHIRIISVQLI